MHFMCSSFFISLFIYFPFFGWWWLVVIIFVVVILNRNLIIMASGFALSHIYVRSLQLASLIPLPVESYPNLVHFTYWSNIPCNFTLENLVHQMLTSLFPSLVPKKSEFRCNHVILVLMILRGILSLANLILKLLE